MKTILWLVLGMTSLFVLSSCNEDKIISNNQLVRSISVTGQDFVDGDAINGTRAAYTVDGSGFHFSWTQGDTVGIYPVGGDQVAFPISSGEGSQTAQFDGGAWALRSTYTYAAYYPFSSGNYHIDETKLPVSFIGQTQNGNASLAALDRFDYQASSATRPDADGNVFISLKHLGCFVRFQLTMPVADTYKSITLQSSKTPFVTSGTYDLSKEDVFISSTATSTTLTIGLNNVSTTDDNKVLTIYAMLAPSDLSDSEITINVAGTKYQSFTATINGKNMQAGKAYSYAATFKSGTNINGSDVEWDDNGQEIVKYVDLGLSVLWATYNVGASKPEEYGEYYAWGESEPKNNYDWSTYKYCFDSEETLTKYCNDSKYGKNGFTDYKTTLDMEDDVAHVIWGGDWRMPTKEEFQELIDNCTWVWTNQNGKNGYKVTSNKAGYTDCSIFLPAAGYRRGNNILSSPGSNWDYWSSSLNTDGVTYTAWSLNFNSNTRYADFSFRNYGLSVRPVRPKKHEYVDLGLSVKWAICNVGASNPEDYGDYYGWGETEPYYVAGYSQEDPQTHWKDGKSDGYDWPTYKHCIDFHSNLTKYCTNAGYGNNGFTDNKTTLDPEDDVAHVKWGGDWRMPTEAEFEELLNNCDWVWTTQNDVNGYKVTSRKDLSSSIFLPAAGYRYNNYLSAVRSGGQYWSSSLDSDSPCDAWLLFFGSSNLYMREDYRRFNGLSVRPVCP